MRKFGVLLHRWLGLGVAAFLFIAGLTGAFISWDHELDAWLNPQLFEPATQGEPLPVETLIARLEAEDPRLMVTFSPLEVEPGHALLVSVTGRIDPATGKAFPLDFNQVALDPVTGDVQGRREWGAISLSRENLLPFLYKLHYTMHLPDVKGVELGMWFMGLVSIAWFLDCFVALYLSFPSWRAWRKSFAFRVGKGGYALNFDVHRSGGVWLWALLLLLAVTSISLNLGNEVVRPVVNQISPLTPTPFETRPLRPLDQPIMPTLTRTRIVELGRAEAERLGIAEPAGAVFYGALQGIYGVGFYEPGNDHGDGGLGNSWLYFDEKNGALLGKHIPGTGSAGDVFMQAQFPLHSGRILGIPGRIFVSLLGLSVAILSVTGVVIWAKKRKGRMASARAARARMQPAAATSSPGLS
ncbi:PepSY domain-containing protein [Pigmentiphaga sp. H8]|uniref:PepSY-associated TM helix domain-containing protein n=1 Tax=unclassified Pigmentiphaga TaxID=2626614 RepID=UPI000F5B817B|nr:PepSY-associated TM helix domain-containing protein [Pigmentiphaga sp. H8]AZG11883.1 PepSY domain-containing protein [Pigmentiphaga sp. H8]